MVTRQFGWPGFRSLAGQSMKSLEQIAGHNEKMPPKSTYFYPKLLTGMVFNSLKKD